MAIIDHKRIVNTALGNAANQVMLEAVNVKKTLVQAKHPAVYPISQDDLDELGEVMHDADDIADFLTFLETLDALLDANAAIVGKMQLL